jgi:hypothetical protein
MGKYIRRLYFSPDRHRGACQSSFRLTVPHPTLEGTSKPVSTSGKIAAVTTSTDKDLGTDATTLASEPTPTLTLYEFALCPAYC